MLENQMDKRFRVAVISATPNPQQTVYAAMHQDYGEGFVADERDQWPSDDRAGDLIVKRLLAGGRGHWGPLENPQIVFNAGYFPHSVVQQARTHRVGVSFDVQSGRYSGQRIVDLAERIGALPEWFGALPDQPGTVSAPQEWHSWVEDVFYLRPVGDYTDRQGRRYTYTETERLSDLEYAAHNAERYRRKIALGFSEEQARGQLCFDFRQHFVVSFNARSLMHFFDLRAKADAQLEIVQLCDLMWPHFEAWMPEVAAWYRANRWGKARLAP